MSIPPKPIVREKPVSLVNALEFKWIQLESSTPITHSILKNIQTNETITIPFPATSYTVSSLSPSSSYLFSVAAANEIGVSAFIPFYPAIPLSSERIPFQKTNPILDMLKQKNISPDLIVPGKYKTLNDAILDLVSKK